MSTKINYLDRAWNFAIGCKGCKSVGLERCWAAILHNRRHKAWLDGRWPDAPKQYHKPFSELQIFEDRLEQPLHWKRPRIVGVCFQSDFYSLPFEVIDQAMAGMALTSQHTYLIPSKQAQNILEYNTRLMHRGGIENISGEIEKLNPSVDPCDFERPLPNVYNGLSICKQKDAAEGFPLLLQVPGKHWISFEPLVGGIDLTVPSDFYIDYAVIGCEKIGRNKPGRFADGFNKAAIDLVKQLQAASVKVFVKQAIINGKVEHDIRKFPKELQVRDKVGG